jgi:hypothetical protein
MVIRFDPFGEVVMHSVDDMIDNVASEKRNDLLVGITILSVA